MPEEIQTEMEFVFCSRMEQVLETALGRDNIEARKEALVREIAEREAKKAKEASKAAAQEPEPAEA